MVTRAPEPSLQAFGSRVRDRRHAAGLSQEDLADRAGIHRTYLSSVERGERNVALLNILKLSKALGVDPADLLSGLAYKTLPTDG